MMDESFFLTRFIAFRIYSIAVIFVKNKYNSSMDAAVLPLPSNWLLMKDRILNNIASLSR